MKNLNKVLGTTLCVFSFAALTACGDNASTATTKYTVSFDTCGGSQVASQQVEENGFATRPENPTKENYSFIGWYKEAGYENIFDFDTEAIVADTTIYANWLDASSSDATKATFYWNYVGAAKEVYSEVVFQDGGRISKPADPVRDGYEFGGWFTTTEYETEYNKTTKYTGNQTFYAKWLKAYTLEAEDTQLTGIEWSIDIDGTCTESGDKKGSNFSGNVSGKNLIRSSDSASGGKFVWGALNLEEGYLDFEFTADKADASAKLSIRVSAEFWGFELTPDMFKVLVNPASNADPSVNYSKIDLTFVETSTNSTTNPTWVDAYINNVAIKEGKNVIRLLVNNSNANTVGTIKAQGPIVDCITIKSTSTIEMKKYTN